MKTNSFESRLALVKNALTKSTRQPPVPKDRTPRVHQKSKTTDRLAAFGLDSASRITNQQADRLLLWKSMINMIGSFLERSPDAKNWKRSELREFITHMEICLELKPGKLSIGEYGAFLIKLDEIIPFKDGEFSDDLKKIDQIIGAYGDKLTQG
jgi:hypothetical protein